MAFNMDPKKCPMPTQDPNVRNKNFEEVALGYTEEMAVNEAKRCIHCKNKPCQTGCPVGIDIPEFIGHVAEGDFEAAYQVINRSSSLPAVCGRVCPQESQCEGKCTRGIKNEPVAIGRLERFVADWHRENVHTAPIVPEWNGHKVAVIGAGPAGLTAAGDLAKLGYKVTVYEALHVAGGVLMYGIPEFRLPKAIVQQEIDGLKKMGVDFECNMVIGKVLTIDELMGEYGYEAVFVGSGAGLPTFIGVPGENANGVYSANEYLTRINLMKAYKENADTPIYHAKKVAVVGGGNVAMDVARSSVRLGADKVAVAYRRRKADMTALPEEVESAMAEGVEIMELYAPERIEADEDGQVKALWVSQQMPGEIRFDASEQDSLTYIAAEKVYMKREIAPAKSSFTRYLQSFPNGAFSLNAHYYLCVIGKEQKDEAAVLEHAGKLLEYPDNPYSQEALIARAEILFNRKQFDQALNDYRQLKAKATTPERRQLAETGMLRSAALMQDDVETIAAATDLLAETKLTPELRNEALYFRAKAYLNQRADKKAMNDLQTLAKDTRTLYGAEAKYLVAQQLYKADEYTAAEKEILNFIDQSTPHAYWLARSFVLLSDVYVAMDKKLDARQYLLSLQQNYHADDDIEQMINERLEKLK